MSLTTNTKKKNKHAGYTYFEMLFTTKFLISFKLRILPHMKDGTCKPKPTL